MFDFHEYRTCEGEVYDDNSGIIFFLSCPLTLKMPKKPASENVVCLCGLQKILANFSNLFLHTGKQCGP